MSWQGIQCAGCPTSVYSTAIRCYFLTFDLSVVVFSSFFKRAQSGDKVRPNKQGALLDWTQAGGIQHVLQTDFHLLESKWTKNLGHADDDRSTRSVQQLKTSPSAVCLAMNVGGGLT